jgi:23S rRNA (uracil1939-C5)-methyltransferase
VNTIETFASPTYPYLSCSHFPRCGGCQTLDLNYSEQLSEKQATIESRFGEVAGLDIRPILASPTITGYRHKVQLPFGSRFRGRTPTGPVTDPAAGNTKVTLGCYAANSHLVVDQIECQVQEPELTACVHALRLWAQKENVSVYNEATHTGLLRHVLLRKGLGTGEVLAGIIVNAEAGTVLPELRSAVKYLQSALGSRSDAFRGLVVNYNANRTNVVLGETEAVIWGGDRINEKLDGLRFKLGLSTFFQVNPHQAPHLFQAAIEGLTSGQRVLDLYCGTGTFTLWAARVTGNAEGWEENVGSIASAKEAVQLNNLENGCRFQACNIAQVLAESNTALRRRDVVIVDPPRKGLERGVTDALVEMGPEHLVYVSCNPNSLARDLALLRSKYQPISLQPVDMIPHTRHIECVMRLTRIAANS